MKRLLLGPALVLPLLTLGLCHHKTPEVPKVPEIVREIPLDDFNHFPPITTPQIPEAPKAPAVKHKPHQVKKHAQPVRPVVRPVPAPSDQGRVEALPPQQGPICIFPLNFIPNCKPQEAQ
jgi:hypothetical protein